MGPRRRQKSPVPAPRAWTAGAHADSHQTLAHHHPREAQPLLTPPRCTQAEPLPLAAQQVRDCLHLPPALLPSPSRAPGDRFFLAHLFTWPPPSAYVSHPPWGLSPSGGSVTRDKPMTFPWSLQPRLCWARPREPLWLHEPSPACGRLAAAATSPPCCHQPARPDTWGPAQNPPLDSPSSGRSPHLSILSPIYSFEWYRFGCCCCSW